MPVYQSIRIAWFNRQTRISDGEDWVSKIHLEQLKRRTIRLNRLHPIIMHWVEERSSDYSEAVNLGTNQGQNMSSATPCIPPPPPPCAFAAFVPPPAYAPPPPAYPPPYPPNPPNNDINQHMYGDQ